jgi:hypothetical protein
MGRKRKFGEESAWVSVRVPKSKVKEYRVAVRRFVEAKFALKTEFEGGSALIMVRVPKSKVEEYKSAIKQLIAHGIKEKRKGKLQRFKHLIEFSSGIDERVKEEE